MRDVSPRTDAKSLFSANRRGFLTRAGGLVAASTALPLAGGSPPRPKVHILAEGAVGFNTIVPEPNLTGIPVEILQQIMSGALQIRQRVTFPTTEDKDEDNDGVLSIQVFIVPSSAPLPLPTPPPVPPSPDEPMTISLFEVQVDRVLLSARPAPNLAILGEVISAPVPSPFGEIVGRQAGFGVGYDGTGEQVSFVMLGGFVAGSHSTWSLTAAGSLVIGRQRWP